ncbi:hypothetical protein GGX14DRAFT_342791, partial [Mycena pura]
IAYFYFDFSDEKRQLVEIMLRSIILQLSAQSLHRHMDLNQQYRQSRDGQTLPRYEDLLGVLDKLVAGFDHTYIVLDALDECNEADLLVQFISRLRRWTTTPLHLLVTSQPREVLAAPFDGVAYVFLESNTTHSDINLFVSAELRSRTSLKHWVDQTSEIATQIVEKSNGMFRLAACLLIELSRRKTRRNLKKMLADLPGELFEIYDRFLKPIHLDDLLAVESVFRWILFSARPISLSELEDTLAFDVYNQHHPVYSPTIRDGDAKRVCELLEGLVTVTPMDEVVSLAHASVADYLVSRGFAEKHRHYDLGEGRSHTSIAQTCMGYLLHFEHNPLNEETFPNYPLTMYAGKYWIYHLLRCHDRAILLTGSFRFLPRTVLMSRQRAAYTAALRCRSHPATDELGTALQIASALGHSGIVRILLDNGADINAAGGEYGTALQTAAEGCNIDIVHLLLEKGADVHGTGGEYGSALQAASYGGCLGIVRLLLERGADVNAQGGKYGNALHAASARGYTNIVRLLLEKGANVNTGGMDGSALHVASKGGHIQVIQMLL